MKIMAPTELQSLLFFAEKAIFLYPAFQCCRDHNFSSRTTKFCVHNLNTYTYPQNKNILLQHTQGGGNFNLKSGLIFHCVYILSDYNVFNVFNAFNVLNGLVLVFLNGLKSNKLKNLTDQQLTEVTFGVTINV